MEATRRWDQRSGRCTAGGGKRRRAAHSGRQRARRRAVRHGRRRCDGSRMAWVVAHWIGLGGGREARDSLKSEGRWDHREARGEA
jgi:hypothetical protein